MDEYNNQIQVNIDADLYKKLIYLGVIPKVGSSSRSYNVGNSNYASGEHIIQPWSIWLDYPNLTSFDHDIIKRVLREKKGESRQLDYEKIIHICEERLRQIECLRNEKLS